MADIEKIKFELDEPFADKETKQPKTDEDVDFQQADVEDTQVDTLNVVPEKVPDEQDLMLSRSRDLHDFHNHNGVNSELVNIVDLSGLIETTTAAPTHTPRRFNEQIKFYDGDLYFYSNGSWVQLEPVTAKAHVRAYVSGVQDITTGSMTTVQFDTENYDTGGDFASYTFTAPRTGYYHVHATVYMEDMADGDMVKLEIRKNTTPFTNEYNYVSNTSQHSFSISGTVNCTANDDIDIRLEHDYGANREVKSGQSLSFVTIDEL